MRHPTLAGVVAATALVLLVSCGGSDDSTDDESPADRLAAAKTSLDDADFIGFTIKTDNLPDDVDGLVEASGTGTHEPAFTGDVSVKASLSINAPVIAVGGVVYAQLPLVGWNEIDPATYGAPDPAMLLDTESGLSSLFTATEDPVAGDEERDGEEVLSTISGTIPGDAVQGVFPSAGTDPFDVSYTLTSDNAIHGIDVTGPFYNGSDDVNYTLTFDLDADEVTIEPPSLTSPTVQADLSSPVGLAPRTLLALAALAVGFAAADTYVVVLALPDMMGSVGLNVDELQRAAPIVSGFLLGYIAMLPLMGRIADLRGRVPVLVGSLVIFSVGSLVTAASYDLVTMVVGRFLQGVGGGGLVPATLALVADIWAVDQRGVPLGVIGAVQELGSVLGPLYGALVLSQADWQAIFWINLAVGLILAAALVVLARPPREIAIAPPGGRIEVPQPTANPHGAQPARGAGVAEPTRDTRVARRSPAPDLLGAVLALGSLLALALVMLEPDRLMRGVTTGLAFIPRVGDTRWTTWMAFACYLLAAAFVIRQLTGRRPLIRLRSAPADRVPFAYRGRRLVPEDGKSAWSRDRLPSEGGLWVLASATDLLGAALLGLSLGRHRARFCHGRPRGSGLLSGGTMAVGRERALRCPLRMAATRRVTSARAGGVAQGCCRLGFAHRELFIGAALIAALVDIPIFARVTVYPDSQLGAALVLVRLLAALPVGALLGGFLLRRFAPGPVAAGGMTLAALGFAWMTQWDKTSLDHWAATLPLVICGLGFGLAVAPVNSALLAATRAEVHGIASALLVVARMVGMLVGVSALTTIGLRRFYAVSADVPPVRDVCSADKVCDAYLDLLKDVGVAQVHAIFWGAAVCAVVAAIGSLALLRPPTVR